MTKSKRLAKKKQPANPRRRAGFGVPGLFALPSRHGVVAESSQEVAPLTGFMTPHGNDEAKEGTDVFLTFDQTALYVKLCCHTADIKRLRRDLGCGDNPQRESPVGDAVELHLDEQRNRRRYHCFYIPFNGEPTTRIGFNNRYEQGWHPSFEHRVTLQDNAWVVSLVIPWAVLGQKPGIGDVWGFNGVRINPSEPSGYTQWAPTLGNPLQPELFGEIVFGGKPGHTAKEVKAYRRFAAEHHRYFQSEINSLSEADVLTGLPVDNWAAWDKHLAARTAPLPLRWESTATGAAGIPENERARILADAQALMARIDGGTREFPDDRSGIAIERLATLGDAYLLTEDRRYVTAFERALDIHGQQMETLKETVIDPYQDIGDHHPYHDRQIVATAKAAYAYLSMRAASLSKRTHLVMMEMVLRAGRFAAFDLSKGYRFGHHQVNQSGGLAVVAALFPEVFESDEWAAQAGLCVRRHLTFGLYPDGGYRERSGCHSFALSSAMQAVMTVKLNQADDRFSELLDSATLDALERMHEWVLHMVAPDGSMPAFGDCGTYSQLTLLQRGALFFKRPEFSWPLQQLAPSMIPETVTPCEPDFLSAPLPSQYTVLRDGWTPDSFYFCVDHGPMGSRDSHRDTLGFVCYAHGRPVALDRGIDVGAYDSRPDDGYTAARSHNVVVIEGAVPEKVAERLLWRSENSLQSIGLRSHAYEYSLQIIHIRTVVFDQGLGWLVHDRLTAPASVNLADYHIDWVLHTPYALECEEDGLLHAADGEHGLIVLAANPIKLKTPVLETVPASVPQPEARMMRLCDATRCLDREPLCPEITRLTWRRRARKGQSAEFLMALLPYRGRRPQVAFSSDGAGSWSVVRNERNVLRYVAME